ncbi:MAG: YSC84-related protein [Steroidobacteraceae bacterium]|jgi:lipid-binding SYLF domain-containing protein|nr:YSC84-related protein [Steroidobacteraceae bacterium]
MRTLLTAACLALALLAPAASAVADDYTETADLFRNAGESGEFFKKSYGYAVFPTIGKAGIGIGGAHGKGRVFVGGKPVGNTKMTQLSVGFQLGAQGYSLMLFFEDKRAFDEFTTGQFEFGAQASAVVITAAASAGASTSGASAGASGGKKDAATAGQYYKGVAPFVIIKGGAMYEASVAGAKFSYEPIK